MSFSLSDSTLKEHLEAIFESVSRFTTSADVVIKASGLRIEAIRAIAREQGIEIENVESRCIDENLLSLLADAHVRRLKSYFNNSKRHIAELSGAELSTFVDFCKTFKKHLSNDHAALSWDDIDTNAIREQFIQKVKKLTPASSVFDEIFGGISFEEIPLELPNHKQFDLDTFLQERQRDAIIERVICSRWLYIQSVVYSSPDKDQRDEVRRVTVSARYHIFSDDNDALLYDTRDMKHYFRAPKEVA